MTSRIGLGLGANHQDSVSMVDAGQERSQPLDDTAVREHGTRPPISEPGACDPLINSEGISSSEINVDKATSTPDARDGVRPPPSPSIPGEKASFTLSLPPKRAKKGCLKQPSPLSSPSLSSPDASPALNYATFYHTLGGPGSSPSTPRSIGSSSRRSSGASTPRKTVSWCSHECQGVGYLEEVFPADDWDRTPTEPARTPLSYKDILELKAIQRTLPHAQQLPDPFTGKPANQILSHVPITLLPLLPDSTPHTPLTTPNLSPNSSTGATPNGSGHSTPSTISPRDSQRGSPEQSVQPSPRQSPRGSPVPSPARSPNRSPERPAIHHTHSPRISSPLVPSSPSSGSASPHGISTPNNNSLAPPTAIRKRPLLNFVPLLDTPPVSPTSAPTNGIDTLPQSLDAALGNLCRNGNTGFSQNDDDADSAPPTPALTVTSLGGCDSCSEVETELSDIGEDVPFGVMFRKDADGSYDSYSRWRGRGREREVSKKEKKEKKNVFYINGEEIDLDGDDASEDSEEVEEVKTSEPESSSCSANVIYINGEPCALDDPIDLMPSKQTSSRVRSRSPPQRTRTPSPPHTHAPISSFHRAYPNVASSEHQDHEDTKPRSHGPISPFHRAHPNVNGRSPSPEDESERKPRSQIPISPFHRAHPNVARTRTPSPGVTEKPTRPQPPISPFHRAHPNVCHSMRAASRSPVRD